MPINDRAMLVSLSVTAWTPTKLDRKISKEVALKHGASLEAINTRKRLIAKRYFDPITAAVTKIRADHYARTLPWEDAGNRILSSGGYVAYTDEARKLEAAFWKASHELWDNWDSIVDDSKSMLNGAWHPDDYPPLSKLKARFACKYTFSVLPDVSDFRCQGLTDGEMTVLRSQIEREQRAKYDVAVTDVWTRIRDEVSHMADKLKGYDVTDKKNTSFRDTLVENVRDLVTLLPSLNVTGNSDISKVTELMRTQLCERDAETLRTSDVARVETASAADAILASLGDYV